MISKFRPLFSAVSQVSAGLAGSNPAMLGALPGMVPTACQQQQVAHVGVAAYTGNKYYISDTLPDTYDAPGYQSTDIIWTPIVGVSDFPSYGSKRAVGNFTPIDGAIEKFVGASNYGSGNIVCADLPTDAGQVKLKAADASNGVHNSIKVLNVDGEIDFLDVIVAGWELAPAKENVAKTRTGMIEVCKAPVNVAA